MKPIICVFCITKLSYMWAALKQIIYIVLISTIFGIIRFFFIEEESFTIIKSQKQLKTIEDYDLNHITNEQYSIPDLMTEPLLATTDFIKYYFDNNHAVIIDARDVEEYSNSHIEKAINIPYNNYEDFFNVLDSLPPEQLYIIYCSGGLCNDSRDLASIMYELGFKTVFIYEGGFPEWKEKGYAVE